MSNETPARDGSEIDPAQHAERVRAWQRARLARLTLEDGWLSLAGKHWLHEGEQRAGSDESCEVQLPEGKAPAFVGTFTQHAGVITFRPAASVQATLQRGGDAQRVPLAGDQALALTTDQNGAPDRVWIGTLSMEVMQRDSGFAVRVRDRESAALRAFSGIDCFPIRHDARVVATLEHAGAPRAFELAYEGGKTERSLSPGTLVFELFGHTLRLDPVIESGGKRLLIVFGDQTNRDTTYGAGRFLYAPLPEGERVVLDFNQAFNPPCAYTPYALCPVPPPQNRLALRIEAGEMKPHT